MRHRAEPSETAPAVAGGGTMTIAEDTAGGPVTATPGRHRATTPLLPRQVVPGHDRLARTESPARSRDDSQPEPSPAARPAPPQTARWRSSHFPRLLAVVMLAAACLGTSTLVVRFAEARTSENTIAVCLAITVIVGLWALLIASTPQQVTLKGSVLTVRNSRGAETFDLADGLQAVDLLEEPRSKKWALLLHRADGSTLVLRRRDVVARELDPLVRHYRRIAERSRAERRERFNR